MAINQVVLVKFGAKKDHYMKALVAFTPRVDLTVQSFGDRTQWLLVSALQTGGAVQAYLQSSDVWSSGALTISALSNASIDATIVAVAAAVGGGGSTGVGVGAAGVYTDNFINSDVRAFVRNSGGTGVSATSLAIEAKDMAGMKVIAAAGAAGVGVGNTGIGVAIGLSIAINEVTGTVTASIDSVSGGVRATTGAISVKASSPGRPLSGGSSAEQVNLSGLTAAQLDTAASTGGDLPPAALVTAFANAGVDIPADITVTSLGTVEGWQLVTGADTWTIVRDGETFTAKLGATTKTLDNYPGVLRVATGTALSSIATLQTALASLNLSASSTVTPTGTGNFKIVTPTGDTYFLTQDTGGLRISKDGKYVQDTGNSALLITTVTFASLITATTKTVTQAIKDIFLASGTITLANDATVRPIAGGGWRVTSSGTDYDIAQNGPSLKVSYGSTDSFEIYDVGAALRAAVQSGALPGALTDAFAAESVVLATDAKITPLSYGAWRVVTNGGATVKTWTVKANDLGVVLTDGATNYTLSGVGGTDFYLAEQGRPAPAITKALRNAGLGGWLTPAAKIAKTSSDEWKLTATTGTYVIRNVNGVLTLAGTTIDALAVSASLAIGFGTGGGVAVSGAGAAATNDITRQVSAFVRDTTIDSAGDLEVRAGATSTIASTVGSVAVAVAGGAYGVGVGIGVSVALNRIGTTSTPLLVTAFLKDSSVTRSQALTIAADASQAISAVVFSAAAGIGIGGTIGVGVAGAGAGSSNAIVARVTAYVDGDGASGINSASTTIAATDRSRIQVRTGALAIAAAFAGEIAVSVSIAVAVAHNSITNEIKAYVTNADQGLISRGGVTLNASETAAIDANTWAAAFALAFAPIGGLALSGAGADAINELNNDVASYVNGGTIVAGAADYVTTDRPASVAVGKRVRLDAGSVYQYIGATALTPSVGTTIDLSRVDYGDTSRWSLVGGDLAVTATSSADLKADRPGHLHRAERRHPGRRGQHRRIDRPQPHRLHRQRHPGHHRPRQQGPGLDP